MRVPARMPGHRAQASVLLDEDAGLRDARRCGRCGARSPTRIAASPTSSSRATDVPGAVDIIFRPPFVASVRATSSRAPPLAPASTARSTVARSSARRGEEAAQETCRRRPSCRPPRTARPQTIFLEPVAAQDRDAFARRAFRCEAERAVGACSANASATNPASPRLDTMMSARAASAAARSGGTARGSALTAQTTLASRRCGRERLARRLGGPDRQADHVAPRRRVRVWRCVERRAARRGRDRRSNGSRRRADRRACRPACARTARATPSTRTPRLAQRRAIARALGVVADPAHRRSRRATPAATSAPAT